MKRITKAIIPAAGLGTRMLPISHAVPKEMLPIVDLPAVYYLVKEAAESGITDILIITNRDKDAMEDFFDLSIEYEKALLAKGREADVKMLREIADLANVYFLRQKETKGLGHAVGRARSFVGDEPFMVLYGDDIIFSETPVCRQMMDVYEKSGKCVVGVKPVAPEWISKYSSLKVAPTAWSDTLFSCDDMIEKPKPEQIISNYAILGRVVLPPSVFDILDDLPPGANGEIQLTDAMRIIAQNEGMIGFVNDAKRYDMGNKLGIMQAALEVGVKHPEIGEDLIAYLKDFVKTLK